MENKHRFDERFKKELCEELSRVIENNELAVRKMLEESGVDTSKTTIIDRAKFLVKYVPDVMEELFEKYGPSKVFAVEVKKEALELIQKRFHEDLAKQPVKSWNIYYLLLHCKIYKPITLLENVTLIPFDGWPCNDYLDIIERLSQNLGVPASHLSEENLKAAKKYFNKIYPEKNPISLLIFRDIEANTEGEAREKTKDYAENVVLCMSNLTNASIEIRGWLIEGKLEGINVLHPTINFSHYKPTYSEPEVLEKVAKKILENLSKNYRLELALRCERDALSDDQDKFRILKRWSALEFIAEEHFNSDKNSNLDKKLLTKRDVVEVTEFVKNIFGKNNIEITPTIERRVTNYVSQINHKEAKEKVRDLLKWANHPIKKNDNSENDIIDVIYQHRNCIVHLGGCSKSDKTIKECNGPAYCKKSILGQVEVNRELSQMLTRIIGTFVGVEFEFNTKIPENIEKTQ
jgi:hypothetical protein